MPLRPARPWALFFAGLFANQFATSAASAQSLNVFEQLQNAGLSIWAIGALSVLALAVALERALHLRRARLVPAGLVDAVLPAWRQGDGDAVQQALARSPSLLAEVLASWWQHRHAGAAALERRGGDLASRALRAHQQRAYPLAVVATVAPIVGLLGTVVGMIEAFHVIAFTGALGDPTLLAGGISKALVNTAAGLTVALPALALHHLFKHRLATVGLALEGELQRVLDAAFPAPEARDAH